MNIFNYILQNLMSHYKLLFASTFTCFLAITSTYKTKINNKNAISTLCRYSVFLFVFINNRTIYKRKKSYLSKNEI